MKCKSKVYLIGWLLKWIKMFLKVYARLRSIEALILFRDWIFAVKLLVLWTLGRLIYFQTLFSLNFGHILHVIRKIFYTSWNFTFIGWKKCTLLFWCTIMITNFSMVRENFIRVLKNEFLIWGTALSRFESTLFKILRILFTKCITLRTLTILFITRVPLFFGYRKSNIR